MHEDSHLESDYEDRFVADDTELYPAWMEEDIYDKEYDDYQDEGFFGSGE
jgi:hypothetical protein